MDDPGAVAPVSLAVNIAQPDHGDTDVDDDQGHSERIDDSDDGDLLTGGKVSIAQLDGGDTDDDEEEEEQGGDDSDDEDFLPPVRASTSRRRQDRTERRASQALARYRHIFRHFFVRNSSKK